MFFGEDELNAILHEYGERLVVVEASMTWCRPCKGFERPFEVGPADLMHCMASFGCAHIAVVRTLTCHNVGGLCISSKAQQAGRESVLLSQALLIALPMWSPDTQCGRRNSPKPMRMLSS